MPDREQMIKRQRVLADFGEYALRCQNLDEILTEACRLVGEALGTERAKVLEIQQDQHCLQVRAGVGWQSGVIGLRLPMSEFSSETFSIETGRPVTSRDIAEENRFEVPQFMKDAGVVALANVPIFLPGGKAYGLLQVDSRSPRDFAEEDTEFLRTYATLLGPVIDRLRKVDDLRASEERFRLIVENARDYAIFIVDANCKIIDWLPGAEAVFGWGAEEIAGQSCSVLFTPEDREKHEDEKEIETARIHGSAPNVRWHMRKDGRRVFIDGTMRALREAGGELRGFLKIGQDVTARRQADERLRESEQRLSLALQVGGVVGTWDWDISNDALRADSRLATLFGVDREKAASGLPLKTFVKAIHPDDRDHVTEAIQKVSKSGGDYSEEHRIVQPDRAEQWVLARGRCLLDETGRPYRFLGVAIDITERKRAEEHQRMLMAELDHRVKNLLAVVQSVAQRSLRGGDGEANVRFSGRLAALAQVHTLLADARWEGASLQRLANEAMAPYRIGYPEGRVLLSGPDLLLTPKAAQTLTLGFHELATNAAKYGALSTPNGRVAVDWDVHHDGDRWLVLNWQEVGGPSIQSPPLAKGFGSLLIERTLTYELGGEVGLDYNVAGLIAKLKLPLAALVKSAPAGEIHEPLQDLRTGTGGPARLTGKRILIVEDQHLIAQRVEEILRAAGCSVVGPVPTIAHATSLVEEKALDAAVLDINLDGEMIWPVAEALKANGTPFLFLTGYAETIEVPPALKKTPRIGKPVEPAQLMSALSNMLHVRA